MFVSSKREDIAKAEEAPPPVWVRKQETPTALHEVIQRGKLSAWYITKKIEGPVAQPTPILRTVPANP